MITLEINGQPYQLNRCVALAILLQTTEDLGIDEEGQQCPSQRAIREHAYHEAHLFAFRKGGNWKDARINVCRVAEVSLSKFENECLTRTTPDKIKEHLR